MGNFKEPCDGYASTNNDTWETIWTDTCTVVFKARDEAGYIARITRQLTVR